MNRFFFSVIATAVVLTSTSAMAHTGHVEEPEVEAKKIHIHNITGVNLDDNDEVGNELELSYGLNDWALAKIAHVSGGGEGESYDWYTGGEFALQFQLTDEGQYRPVSALYVSYDWHAQSMHADNVNLMGIFRKHVGPTNNLINLKFSHNVGPHSEGGIGFDAAARSTYEFSHSLGLGVEYFGEFGQIDDMEDYNRQGHQFGPVITFEPFESVHMHGNLAYLFGISEDAPDGTIKLEVGAEF